MREGKEIGASGGGVSTRWHDWQWQLRNRVRSLTELAAATGLPARSFASLKPVAGVYPFAITPYYWSLVDAAAPDDPLRRQCVPDPREIECSGGGLDDPLGEEEAMPTPGLIHRYPDRCLAIVTNECAVYCRHCNRKRLWQGPGYGRTRRRLRAMVDYVSRTPAVREVIVSGGDPLLIAEELLDWFLGALRAIRHVEVLRIGSRVPATLPMRVTPQLCAMLKRHRPLWFNTQFNHGREVTPEAAAACEMLLTAGIPVSNQSVLLRGVNDDTETMRDLLTALERISVRPYYLFQCDPVRGTDHFRTDPIHGMEIMERLRRTLSGLCLPRYVLDCPGGRGKIPLQRLSLPSAGDAAGEEKQCFDNGDRID
ncbi:MAG: KamA family radical SAM protein [Syntrophales bacterium]